MTRLLICDDHALVREGLKQILADAQGLSVVGEAGDAAEAMRRVRGGDVDVVLLDIALPGRDGFEVLKQVRRDFARIPVLIVSTYPEKQYALRSLRLGAAGYVNKGADPAELVAAVRKVAGGGLYVSPLVAESLAGAVRHEGTLPPHELLSAREHQVFLRIAAGESLSEIARALSLSLNTVSTYRARIMEKIGTQNDVETALYAVRHHLVHIGVGNG